MARLRRRIAAALVLPALFWFFWFENSVIVSETYEAELSSLPEAFDGFRLALVSVVERLPNAVHPSVQCSIRAKGDGQRKLPYQIL